MYEWVKLQGRSGRFLLLAVLTAVFGGGVLYARATDPPGNVTIVEADQLHTDHDGTGLVMLVMVAVLIGIGWFGSSYPMVKVDADGFTELGLPWRRTGWREVEAIELKAGLYLKYVVVTRRRLRARDIWLTRGPVLDFRTPDLDEELETFTVYWNAWKRRHHSPGNAGTGSPLD